MNRPVFYLLRFFRFASRLATSAFGTRTSRRASLSNAAKPFGLLTFRFTGRLLVCLVALFTPLAVPDFVFASGLHNALNEFADRPRPCTPCTLQHSQDSRLIALVECQAVVVQPSKNVAKGTAALFRSTQSTHGSSHVVKHHWSSSLSLDPRETGIADAGQLAVGQSLADDLGERLKEPAEVRLQPVVEVVHRSVPVGQAQVEQLGGGLRADRRGPGLTRAGFRGAWRTAWTGVFPTGPRPVITRSRRALCMFSARPPT